MAAGSETGPEISPLDPARREGSIKLRPSSILAASDRCSEPLRPGCKFQARAASQDENTLTATVSLLEMRASVAMTWVFPQTIA